MGPNTLNKVLQDPAKMDALLAMVRADLEESRRTGETPHEMMLREKREWADADARSAKLKDEANDLFRKGEYKAAYIVYSACAQLSPHEPLYFLNRAAACLSKSGVPLFDGLHCTHTYDPLLELRLYTEAVEILAHPIDLNYRTAKALFRRGQAQRFLGHFDEAEDDFSEASLLEPNDLNVLRELDELKKLKALGTEDKDAWVITQDAQTVDEVFGEGQLEPLVNARLAQED